MIAKDTYMCIASSTGHYVSLPDKNHYWKALEEGLVLIFLHRSDETYRLHSIQFSPIFSQLNPMVKLADLAQNE